MVRGMDLLCSSPQQRYLQGLLGLPYAQYAHIPLVVGERDRRLSKRDHDAALDSLLERFKTPEAIIGHIAGITGLALRATPQLPKSCCKHSAWVACGKNSPTSFRFSGDRAWLHGFCGLRKRFVVGRISVKCCMYPMAR